jgi:hypothetical protein
MILAIASICALVFAILAFCLSAWSCIQIEAMKRSTHQITYIDPLTQNFDSLNKEQKEKMTEQDNLETLQ